MPFRFALVIGLFAAAISVPAAPSSTSAPVDPVSASEALDRRIGELRLESAALPAALETIGQRAGVRFSVDDDTYAVLPWGRETRLASLSVSAGATLRATLEQILRPLGLNFSLQDDARRTIVVEPSPPLARMNRRATWDDLRLLNLLETTPHTSANLAKVNLQYRITSKVNAPQLLSSQLKRSGDGTLAQMLTTATNALGWTWYPDGDHVVILSAQAHIAHSLARTVTARYHQMGLAHILLDLAQKADVSFKFEPGLMQKLPPSAANNYSLMLQHTSIREALELICAETGLQYEIQRDGAAITLSPAAARPGAAPRTRGDPYVARIVVPAKNGNYSYEFLIRESELPEDIREYRGQMIDELIERVRVDMAPGETPTTQKP